MYVCNSTLHTSLMWFYHTANAFWFGITVGFFVRFPAQNWNFLFPSCCLVVVPVIPLLLHHAFQLVFQDRETRPLLTVIRPALIHQTVHLKSRRKKSAQLFGLNVLSFWFLLFFKNENYIYDIHNRNYYTNGPPKRMSLNPQNVRLCLQKIVLRDEFHSRM